MKNKSGNTAYGAAAVRLLEQYQPDSKRLFDDPVIYYLTNSVLRFIIGFKFMRNYFIRMSEETIPGIIGAQICRTKFIDAKTLEVLKGVEQVLILGAGLDTRAYRLKGIEQNIIFEIDLPEVQRNKKKKLKRYLGTLPGAVRYIPIDFNSEKLERVLKKTSFDSNKPTLVILEAVTQYINEDAVREVLAFIAKLNNSSYLLFTYVLRDVIEGKTEEAKRLMNWSARKNCPFIFGLSPAEVKSFLQNYDLEVVEDVGAEFYRTNYLAPVSRAINVFEGERTNFSRVMRQ